MNLQLAIPKDRLAEFCRTHGIKQLAVFGSALREDFGPESDIDALTRVRTPTELLAHFDRIVTIALRRGPATCSAGSSSIWS